MAAVAVKRKNTIPATCIYLGPNIPGGALQTNQVFRGGLPPWCEDWFGKIPEIRELFVPVEELGNMRKKIKEPGTNESRLFSVVARALQEVK